MSRPASMDPGSKGYQRLARRIAASRMREALRLLRRCGTIQDLREATHSIYEIVERRWAAKEVSE